jgi:hypothetical protein
MTSYFKGREEHPMSRPVKTKIEGKERKKSYQLA